MSLAVWLGAVRKCSAAVVGLDLVLGLSMVRRCSLKRSFKLPKIHKPGNPGRPIVSSNSHPTERISQFVDYHLKPLVHKLPSFVKDTNEFLNKLLTIGVRARFGHSIFLVYYS